MLFMFLLLIVVLLAALQTIVSLVPLLTLVLVLHALMVIILVEVFAKLDAQPIASAVLLVKYVLLVLQGLLLIMLVSACHASITAEFAPEVPKEHAWLVEMDFTSQALLEVSLVRLVLNTANLALLLQHA